MSTWNEFVRQRRQAYPDILKDHLAGMGGTELSEKYGLSRQRIYRILKKLTVPATPVKVKRRSLKLRPKKAVKKRKTNGTKGPDQSASPDSGSNHRT